MRIACLKRPLKRLPILVFNRLSLNEGQNYCRMLHREHSAILSTFIKLSFVIKIFVLPIFEWPFKTALTVKAAINVHTDVTSRANGLHFDLSLYLHTCI